MAAVLARERHALCHGVIDDAHRELGQPVHVRFARPEVAALESVVEEPLDAVAVVLVVLRGVDPTLRGHAVGAPGRIVEGQAPHAIAELRQRGRGGGAGQPGAHDEEVVAATARRADELEIRAPALPAGGERPGRRIGAELGRHRSHPASTAMGTDAKPRATAADTAATAGRRRAAAASGRAPRLRAAAPRPWKRCKPRSEAAAT